MVIRKLTTMVRLGLVPALLLGGILQLVWLRASSAQAPTSTVDLPPGIDVAIEQQVLGSSATDAQPAANAVDGDPATVWCPVASASAAQLTVSFVEPYQLTGTAITWQGTAPAAVAVETSVDGSTWQPYGGQPARSSSPNQVSRSAGPAAPLSFVRVRFSDPSALPCVASLRVFASPRRATQLLRGADLSTLPALEAAGKTFSDANGIRPAEQILADHDLNLVRLRLWVDPPSGLNTLADVAAMARRIKRANLQFLLDVHYSDFWADPTHQDTPAAWQGQDLPALARTVHDYTASVIATLDRQGTPPDIVQIGNEVSTGMLWPEGRIYVDGQQRWDAFTTLLAAGIAGARAGASPGHVPRIMVHIEQGGDRDGAVWFYDHLRERGVEFDMIGLSFYRYWQGSLSDVRATLDALALRYGTPIMIVETAHPWTLDDQDGRANIVGPSSTLPPDYPATPEGQAFLVRDLLSVVARTPGNLGVGVAYWEPAWIPGVGWKPGEAAVWDNQTLFDAQGRALESIDALRVNPVSTPSVVGRYRPD